MNSQLPSKLSFEIALLKHHRYQQICKVGSGNFGQAYLVQSSLDGRRYIMKKISLRNCTKQSKQLIFKEVQVMQTLRHCYIIRYLESFIEGRCVCIVMEYAEKGDLQRYLEKAKAANKLLSEQLIVQWFVQLCLGLKYVHDHRIVHRDLKPDNVFISAQDELKIGDFGISKVMNETFDLAKTRIGSPMVMAPQIWEGMRYNQKSDIWSLGCILYKMLTLRYPFQAENEGALIVKLYRELPPIEEPYSQDLKALAMELLDNNPQTRPSVYKILEKPFIKRNLASILSKTINLHDQMALSECKMPASASNEQENEQKKILPFESHASIPDCQVSPCKKESHTALLPPPLHPSQSSKKLLKKRSLSSQSVVHKTPKQANSPLDYQKIVQYQQNYPMLLEENRHLKKQLQARRLEKETLQTATSELITKCRQDNVTKQEATEYFQNLILNYLYP